MSSRTRACLVLCSSALFGHALHAEAQGYPFSQRGEVRQNVAFTEISIAYGRPTARGRVLFPDLVGWERAWNPGADSATRITVSRDIEIQGRALSAGEYTIWLIPRERAPWTMVLSRAAHVFHTPYPGEAHDALRVEIAPVHGDHMETLAFYFPMVLREEAELRFHWGTTVLPVSIRAAYRPDEN
ncbi:MAG TPA: DUF2911 domain-containing protein [Gemmatimonadaceae bacterium]|nr:DUF2911 domain-containing protein [Gemmatimonadaceae bacterium]